MAKYSVTYENNTERHELTFGGKIYDFTMKEMDDCSKCSDKECFSYQLEKDGIDLEDIDIDMLDCSDEGEIHEILNQLSEIEQGKLN